MTWVKLGDELSGAAEPLSDAAFRTHAEALLWSARHLLDLQVPTRHLARFAYCQDPDLAVKELVEAGWWEERGDGWYIGLRWPEWQREKAEVERERAASLERQHRRRKHVAGDHSTCVSTTCPQVRPQAPGVESTGSRRDIRRESRDPVPSRPVPKGSGRDGGKSHPPSRRDRPPRRPTIDQAESELARLSSVGRDGYRHEAIDSLHDWLPEDWQSDLANRQYYESHIGVRMKNLMLADLVKGWQEQMDAWERTGT